MVGMDAGRRRNGVENTAPPTKNRSPLKCLAATLEGGEAVSNTLPRGGGRRLSMQAFTLSGKSVGEVCITGRNVADAFPISVSLRVYMPSCGGIVVLWCVRWLPTSTSGCGSGWKIASSCGGEAEREGAAVSPVPRHRG